MSQGLIFILLVFRCPIYDLYFFKDREENLFLTSKNQIFRPFIVLYFTTKKGNWVEEIFLLEVSVWGGWGVGGSYLVNECVCINIYIILLIIFTQYSFMAS